MNDSMEFPRNPYKLDKKWQTRFAFYAEFGDPRSSNAKTRLRRMPFRKRYRISLNWYAFFFSLYYMLVLGLWKKVLTTFVVLVPVVMVIQRVDYHPKAMINVLLTLLAIYQMRTVNYMYFMRKTRGYSGWNPLRSN